MVWQIPSASQRCLGEKCDRVVEGRELLAHEPRFGEVVEERDPAEAVAERAPDQDASPRPQHTAELVGRPPLVRDVVVDVREERGIEVVAAER